MQIKKSPIQPARLISLCKAGLILALFLLPVMQLTVHAQEGTPTITPQGGAEIATPTGTPVTAQGIIDSFNALRRHYNMRALIVDPILAGLAQQTSDTMALYGMDSHIGGVRDRAIAAGYGAGDIPWLTENFAIGPMSLEELMMAWSDADHMRGANNQWYAHCGVGISEYNGDVYYVFIAGYTSNRIYKPGATALPGQVLTAPISQVMFPVTKATPGSDGRIIHTVKHGQTLWSIAIAYGTHILDIQRANGMTADKVDLSEGQQLVIPNSGVSNQTETPPPPKPSSTQGGVTETEFLSGTGTQITPTPVSEKEPGVSSEFVIVLVAILAAVGLIGFGLFVGRQDKD
jgi:LysM repeat protein/uncharacterized protein YkwD